MEKGTQSFYTVYREGKDSSPKELSRNYVQVILKSESGMTYKIVVDSIQGNKEK